MIFSICLSILLLAWLLGRMDWFYERIAGDKPGLPGLCVFRNATGLPCPGCGLTRAFVAAGRGDFASSFHFHRLGWLVIFYTILQMLRHGGWLILSRARPAIERFGLWLDRGLLVVAAALLVNWFYTLASIFHLTA